MKTGKISHLIIAVIFFVSMVGNPGAVFANVPDPQHPIWFNPNDSSHLDTPVYGTSSRYFSNGNHLLSWDWPAGGTVHILSDNPATPANPDFDYTTYADSSGHLSVDLPPAEITVLPGYTLTISGGGQSVSSVISSVHVTKIDVVEDTIEGYAEPDAELYVEDFSNGAGNGPVRYLTADEDGYWKADFSTAGSEPDEFIVDIHPGSQGYAVCSGIGSGATTAWAWKVPAPGFKIYAEEDTVEGFDWLPNTTVTLTIDHPGTPLSPDYAEFQTSDSNGNTPTFRLSHSRFDAAAGDIVTMSDGLTTQTHAVAYLLVTDVDPAADTVTGKADAGAEVHVWVNDSQRVDTADGNGDWSVDYSSAEGDQPAVDLEMGSGGDALIFDEYSNQTAFNWSVTDACPPGDSVSGHVYQEDGVTPIPNANLQFSDFDTDDVLFTTLTDASGHYGCALSNGDYRIMAYGDFASYGIDYFPEYYQEARYDNASRVHVDTGTSLENINFTLTPGLPIVESYFFNNTHPLLQDDTIAKAIALGTDRQRMLDEGFLPNDIYGRVVNAPISPASWAVAPDAELDQYPFDPDTARTMLTSAGWTDRDEDGFRENVTGTELAFTLRTNYNPGRIAGSEIFRQNMADIGIRIDLVRVRSRPADACNFDIVALTFTQEHEDDLLFPVYVTGAPPLPYSGLSCGYSNTLYDAQIAAADAVSTHAEKLPFLVEAQKILMSDLPFIPLFTRSPVAPITTHTGSDISVSPEDYLTVTYDTVTQQGLTAVVAMPAGPAKLPAGFQLLGKIYEIGTNAVFSGNVQVCFTYDDHGLTSSQESAIRLFHKENSVWEDVTDSGYPNVLDNKVCGTVTGFSPFAIMYPPPTCYTLTKNHTGSGVNPYAAPANSTGCSWGKFHEGETIKLTASPSSGYSVGSWTGTSNDASTSKTNSVVMPASNKAITANYVQTCYTLTKSHTGSGVNPYASPANSTGCSWGKFHSGQTITLTASPASGYRVGSWAGTSNNSSTSKTNRVVMPASNKTVAVNYVNIPSAPVLLAPTNSSVITTLTPTLDWAASLLPSGTTFKRYRIQVSKSSTFSPLVFDKYTTTGSASAHKFIVGTGGTSAFLPGTRYYWRVRTELTNSKFSSWSTVWSLRTTVGKPVNSLPANHATVKTSTVTFKWSAPTVALGTRTYRLQYSKSSTFASPTTVSVSTNTKTVTLPSSGKYYWRVQAVTSYFGTSSWSTAFDFNYTKP